VSESLNSKYTDMIFFMINLIYFGMISYGS